MLNPITAATTILSEPTGPLTAYREDRQAVGLFTQPIDVTLLEQLQTDEVGRRSPWVPTDCEL
jgi:hypothetical protein